jgi:hypothetical protein
MDLKDVVEEFAGHIVSLLEAQATEKARAEILGAFGMGARRKPGRPAKTAVAVTTVAPPVATKRRKLPPQYCPVPYCRNVAAPIFGMVCSQHKDVPKAQIKQYREERRAKKEGVKPAKKTPAKRAKRVAKKPTRAMTKISEKASKRAAKKVPKRAPKKEKASVATPAASVEPAATATS